jgi:uncharacterized membrane protein
MISIVKKYLGKNNYKSQGESFEDFFLSHPNYPSLFAITDSLNNLGIDNLAIKIPKEQFIELPESFLAVFHQNLVLVSKKSDGVTIEMENRERKRVSINEFLSNWNEVIIAVEPNNDIVVESGTTNINWLRYSLPVVTLIIISMICNNHSPGSIVFLVISIVGFILSVLIIAEKFGIKNEMVSKFCNSNPNVSCNSVIKSDRSEINTWIDFSDLPLLFFGINTISVLIEPKTTLVAASLCLMALPIIAYSVWLQKMKVQKWCFLCLGISVIIVVQAVVFWFQNPSLSEFFSINFFGFVFSLILFSTLWLLLKPVLEKKTKAESDVRELKRFKRKYSVFKGLTKEIQTLNNFDKLEGICFGNKKADVHLTVIINPSCRHCHKSFQEAYELAVKFPNRFLVKVLFNINPENNDNPYRIVAQRLLAINNHDPEKAKQAIIDWHIGEVGLDEWKQKWEVDFIDMKTTEQLHQQYRWCLENHFNYTPVKIIDGRLFPKEYEIGELKYFLTDLSEEKKMSDCNISA